MDLREDETAGTLKADRHNDLLSASIGTAEHPGRLRAYSSGYTKVKNVYGKGSRRRSHAAEMIYEQNQKIQELSQLLQEQSQQIKQQNQRISQMEAMMGRVLQHFPLDAQHDFEATHPMPSHIPTQVSSNHVPPQQPPVVDEVTISFMFFFF